MTPRRVSADEAIGSVAALADGHTRLVGLDGFGASGKTTLAAAIAAAVPGALVIHIDDLAGPRVAEWEWPRLQAQVLDPLAAGRPGRYQRWDWDADAAAAWHDVPTGRVVVIEGVSSTRREVRAAWALTIWVEAPADVRLARALERDGPQRMARWYDDWIPSEQAYAARERPQERVDLIVPGSA